MPCCPCCALRLEGGAGRLCVLAAACLHWNQRCRHVLVKNICLGPPPPPHKTGALPSVLPGIMSLAMDDWCQQTLSSHEPPMQISLRQYANPAHNSHSRRLERLAVPPPPPPAIFFALSWFKLAYQLLGLGDNPDGLLRATGGQQPKPKIFRGHREEALQLWHHTAPLDTEAHRREQHLGAPHGVEPAEIS